MVTNVITSLGAGSGIDTIKLVEDLVAIERAPEDERLDQREETYSTQLSGYGVLRSAFGTLQESLALLKDADNFNAKTAAFPSTDLITPNEIKADAQPGEYQLEVLQTARAHSLSSATFGALTDPVGTGTLTFTFGSWSDGADPDGYATFAANAERAAQTITIDATNNSLTGLRDAINQADFGVTATIISDAGGYRLMITGPTGASNELKITVSENPADGTNTDASGLSRFAFDEAGQQLTANQAGRDAQIRVNGLTVTKESNQIDDVVQGLDFTLNKASPGEVIAFSITSDTAAAEQSIRDFVTAYNDFYQTVTALTGEPNEEDPESTDGALRSDPSARTILSQVRSLISQEVVGADSNFNALAFAGIRTELDGTLSIDDDTLADAVKNNFDSLVKLFAPSSSSSDAGIQVTRTKDTTAPGTYEVIITAQPAKGTYEGQAIVNNAPDFDFDPVTDSFTTPLDASAFDYSFVVTVDGVQSGTVSLTGTYNTMSELVADLQTQINGDSALKAAGASVTVTYDTATDKILFTSNTYGSSSKVSFSSPGADLANLGFSDTLGTATAGSDVAGSIDGVTAFGSGNVLLPELGSELSGLALEVTPGAASATITIGQGFGTAMNNLINSLLDDTGLVSAREERLNDQLEDVKSDREDLDRRMETRTALLQAQFIAMESIISTLQGVSDSLDGLLDRLPFTAKSN